MLLASLFAIGAPCSAQDTAQPGATVGNAPAPGQNPEIFLPLPEPTLEGFKKAEPGIDPKAWQLFDAPNTEFIRARQAKAPKHIDVAVKTVRAAAPGAPSLTLSGTDYKVLDNGLRVGAASTVEGPTDVAAVSLNLMGLIPVYSRAHVTVQTFAWLTEGTLTSFLADLPKFDLKPAALAPGGTFGWEQTVKETAFNRRVYTFTSSPKPVESSVTTRVDCTVGERFPAAEVFREFTGTALKVSCARSGNIQVTSSMVYLEDYAWFLNQGESTAGITVENKVIGAAW